MANQRPSRIFSIRGCGADTPGGIESYGPALTVRSKTSSFVAAEVTLKFPWERSFRASSPVFAPGATTRQASAATFLGVVDCISSETKQSGGCGRAKLPTSSVCREVTVREDVHPPGFKKILRLKRGKYRIQAVASEKRPVFLRGAVVSWPPPESSCHFQQVQCRQSGPSHFFAGRGVSETASTLRAP